MMNKMGIQIVNRWILFFLCYLSIPFLFLEASLINPDLAPKLLSHTDFGSGYEDFAKGRTYFNEENWEDAIYFFTQAIEKSYKPDFECRNYLDDEGYRHICEDYSETVDGYIVREPNYEIILAIYRHSHFYWGLIRLYQGEIPKANFHFKKAIGFKGRENNLGFNFYKCANLIHPSWIALASLTRLYMGEAEEAESLMNMAFWTLESFEDILSGESEWSGSVLSKYWHDLTKRGIRSKKWHDMQLVMTYNTASIIASFQNDLEKAIELVSQAIQTKDNAIKEKVFSGESENHSVLYYNRGMLYTKKGDYHKALLDFTKAIELNPNDPNLYFNCGNIYLDLEEYSAALSNYQQAIAIDPNNCEYDRQCALAYAMNGSLNKAKASLYSFKKKENHFKKIENEWGLHELSTGSYSKAIDHFNQFISANPSLAVGYQNRGVALLQAGDLKKSLDDFDEAIKLEPDNADIYQLRAIALMTFPSQREEEAKSYLTEAHNNLITALELNTNDPKIYQNLAAVHSLEGDLDAALECYTKALSLSSEADHLPSLKNLILIHFKREEYEKAFLYCEKAMQMGCKDGDIDFVAGLCSLNANQFEKALTHFQSAIQHGYKDTTVFFHRAKAYFCLHQLNQALEDATRVLKADPLQIECYKLRGLILLALHRESEAYADFSKALNIDVVELSSQKSYAQNSKRIGKNIRGMSYNNPLMTSLGARVMDKPQLQSMSSHEKSLIKEIGKIDLHSFGKGVGVGLMEGGKETLNEIGPFLTHLLFHPIDTTEELLTAVQFLLTKALEEDWETVCEALIPELKELFSTWDKINDYQKGNLLGVFIGKNGMAALTAIGVVKTFSKLKHVVIGCDTTTFLQVLKRTKPKFTPLPASEIPVLPVPKNKEWRLTCAEGTLVEKSFVSDCPLVQIASDHIQNQALLEAKAIDKLQAAGSSFQSWETFETSVLVEQSQSLSADFRKISPPVIEAEVTQIGSKSGKLEIAFNENGEVTLAQTIKPGKIFVRNLNTKKHIMQPKHAWDKLIKLTGDVEKDCGKVIQLLEENKIYLEKYRLDPIDGKKYQKLIRYDHQMAINEYEVVAIFNEDLETGNLFLNDAWIITK